MYALHTTGSTLRQYSFSVKVNHLQVFLYMHQVHVLCSQCGQVICCLHVNASSKIPDHTHFTLDEQFFAVQNYDPTMSNAFNVAQVAYFKELKRLSPRTRNVQFRNCDMVSLPSYNR